MPDLQLLREVILVIDVHAHYFPPVFVDAFARLSGGRKAGPEHLTELDCRLKDLDAAGIERQVLGLGQNQPYFDDGRSALECSRLANDLYADIVERWDGRFAAFGAVPLPHVDEAIGEASRCLDDLGFAGIGIGTTVAGRALSDPVLDPFWTELDRRRTTVFVHPVGTPGTVPTGLDGFMLAQKLGGPQEATFATAHLVLSGVTSRYPAIRWIIAQMGGTLPYLWRRFEEISESIGHRYWRAPDPRAELRKLYYDTSLTDDPLVYRFFADWLGIDRLVLGTDAPRSRPADWISRVKAVPGIASDELERILGGAARTELRL